MEEMFRLFGIISYGNADTENNPDSRETDAHNVGLLKWKLDNWQLGKTAPPQVGSQPAMVLFFGEGFLLLNESAFAPPHSLIGSSVVERHRDVVAR